jgi:hypothetical protein
VLALTSRALTAIGVVVASSDFDLETAGLRIWWDPEADPPISMAVVALRGEDDAIVELGGARMFVEQGAERYMETKLLDAKLASGVAVFILDDRPPGCEEPA